MISGQFTLWEDPSKTLGGDGLKFAVDRRGEMTVLPGKTQAEDLFQIHETIGDFLPLLGVDRFHPAALVLGLLQPASGVIEDDLSRRGTGQDFSPLVGRVHSMKHPVVPPGKA